MILLIPNLWQLYSILYENIVLRYCFYIFILSQTLSTQNLGLFTNRSWLSGTCFWSPFLNLTVTKDKCPPSSTDRLLVNSVKIFGLINSTVNKTFLVFVLLLCSYNAAKFSLKNKAILFSPVSKWFYSFPICGNYILYENIVLRYCFYIFILSQTLSTQNLGLFTNRSWLSGTCFWSPFLNLTVTKDRRSLVTVTIPARYHSGMSGLWTAITGELTEISFISEILSITSTGSVLL